jgi:hypothetical protein
MGRSIPVSAGAWNANACACGRLKDKRSVRCRACYSAVPSTKACTLCKRTLAITDFYLRGSGRPLQQCKACVALRRVKPEYSAATRSRPGHYKQVAARITRRRRDDPIFALSERLRASIRQALKRNAQRKDNRTVDLIGCSIEQFRAHIEAQWRPGMSWANYGPSRDRWQLDHIRPVASFDLADQDQVEACFHYSNYQPLWTPENASKRDRWAA